MRMTPSDNSTCSQTASFTRSAWKKRDSCSVIIKDRTGDLQLHKKARGATSLISQTSPRRRDNPDAMGQLTQESTIKSRSSPKTSTGHEFEAIDVNLHSPIGRRQLECLSFAHNLDDDFRKVSNRANICTGETAATEEAYAPIKSMVLQSENLARAILAAYEKERETGMRGKSEIEAEVARLHVSNKAAVEEVANLRLENAEVARKEVTATSKLEKLLRERARRDEMTIFSALVMSKALMLREKEESDGNANSEIVKLRVKNVELEKLLREDTETRARGRLEMEKLRSLIDAAAADLTQVHSEKAELLKERGEREAAVTSMMQDFLSHLEAATAEVQQLRSEKEALLKEKDVESGAAHAVSLELDKVRSENETRLREMHAAVEMASEEIKQLHSSEEATTAKIMNLLFENEKLVIQINESVRQNAELMREKEQLAREMDEAVRKMAETETLTRVEITRLQSERAAVLRETEHIRARASRDAEKLRSRFEASAEKLKQVRKATGLEMGKLRSEKAGKDLELRALNRKLKDLLAEKAESAVHMAAEVHKLSREKEESQAREAVALDKLRSVTLSTRAHSEMHLAFLTNCGLLHVES